jgi:hypothetical protein
MPLLTNNSARMRPWLRVVIFVALVGGVLFGLGKFFDRAAKQDLREKARWIISKRNESYDFAVLGASRPYVGVNIPTLEHKLGTKGVNLAIDGTTYPEQYLALTLFLAHNHTKQLILDVNIFGFDSSAFKYPFRAYEYLPWIDDPVVFGQLHEYFGGRAFAWKYIPFFKNVEFNSKIGVIQSYTFLKSKFDPRAKIAEFDRYGSRLIEREFDEPGLASYSNVTWKVESLPQKYFLRLLELARTNQIDVTMIMLPEYQAAMDRQLNRQTIIDYYAAVAASNNIPLLRFDQDAICRDKTKFYNVNHLNRRGAMEFSEQLADRLAATNAARIK